MKLFGKHPGTPASAQIVGMEITERGARQTGRVDVEQRLQLAVAVPDGSSFDSDYTCHVPQVKTPLVGDTIPVEIDAERQSVLKVLFDEMPDLAERSRASAAAAHAGDSAGAAAALGFTLRDPEEKA